MDKEKKTQKIKDLAEILDADKAKTSSLVLLRKINELKDELANLQKLLGIVENNTTQKTGEVLNTLNKTQSDIEDRLNKLTKDITSVSKGADFSVDYFKGELRLIKNTISDLKAQKPEVIDRVIERTEVIKEVPFVDAPQIALEASKLALERTKQLIKPIPPLPTFTAIIKGINDEEGTLIKKEKVEGLDELERKADFALSRPFFMGGGGEVLKIKGGQNIRVDQVGGVSTISVTGSLGASSFTDLDDTFSSYAGLAGKGLRVNATADGIDTYTPTDTDEKVKYDVNDPTAGYVADKIIAGTGITVAEGTGANENKLVITGTPDLSGYLLLSGGTMTGGITNSTSLNPLTTKAEAWIGPSSTAGLYFKGGNVGIGTTNPRTTLDVTGNMILGDNTLANSLLTIYTIDDGSYSHGLVLVDYDNQYGTWQSPSGLDGISTDEDGVPNGWENLYFNYYSDGDIFFNTGGGDSVFEGNVGIGTGTGSLSEKLVVSGNIKLGQYLRGTNTISLNIESADGTVSNTTGAGLIFKSGDGFGVGAAGGVTLQSGDGGATGNGGEMTFLGGNGGATSGSGAAVLFTAGSAIAEGAGGAITFSAGDAVSAGSTPYDGADYSFRLKVGVNGGRNSRIKLIGASRSNGYLNWDAISADRDWALPDASGTIALTSDISGFLTLDQTTPQTISNGMPDFTAGLKTYSITGDSLGLTISGMTGSGELNIRGGDGDSISTSGGTLSLIGGPGYSDNSLEYGGQGGVFVINGGSGGNGLTGGNGGYAGLIAGSGGTGSTLGGNGSNAFLTAGNGGVGSSDGGFTFDAPGGTGGDISIDVGYGGNGSVNGTNGVMYLGYNTPATINIGNSSGKININTLINLVGVTENPSSLVAGDIWYRSDIDALLFYNSNSEILSFNFSTF